MKISVIIPVRNEAESIQTLLDGLLGQTRIPDEIVITDGGSTDSTREIIREYAKTRKQILLISVDAALPGRGRNLAAAKASGDWLAFIDAGTRPHRDWLGQLAARVERSSAVDVVYGFWEPVTETFFTECAAIAYVPPPLNHGGVITRPRSIASCLMRKSVWAAVGGFPEHLRSAEDLLFMREVERAGYRTEFEPTAVVHWSLQPTLASTFRKFVTYSCNNIRAGLWRDWQYRIFVRYGLLLLLAIPALSIGWIWLLPIFLLWLLMMSARAGMALWRNRMIYPAGLGRKFLRLCVLVPLIATLDGAAIIGSIKWVIRHRHESPANEQAASKDLAGRRILFISYNGMLDPLGQSQVIPYLRELARLGVQFTLLSFERPFAFTNEGSKVRDELQERLRGERIEWHSLRYHQKPSLPATAFDVWSGIRYARYLVKRNGIEMVHARSHIPATIALALKRRFGMRMIFDIRGLMAEEYRDAAHWREGSVAYRITKSMERRALAAADGVVTLTERIWPIIKTWEGLRDRDVVHEVIPCCADLGRFRFSQSDREERRRELGLRDEIVIVYSGSIDGWYLTEEMADFCAFVAQQRADAHFLWLTRTKHDRIRRLMHERGIATSGFTVCGANPADVPSYLSAADAGLAFIKPCFSKLASSPTKTAEYLACGLPLIINAGIGDADVLVTQQNVGALVNTFNNDEYSSAFHTIVQLLRDREAIRRKTREVAESFFNLETIAATRYARLYENVLAGTVPATLDYEPSRLDEAVNSLYTGSVSKVE